MPNPPKLTLGEAQQQQALAEGFQDGPLPPLNPANEFTQIVELGNNLPQTPPPYIPAVPYYPPATIVTPNLGLSLQGLDTLTAENFVIIDTALTPAGTADNIGVSAGQLFSFTPIIAGLFNIVIVATSVPP